MDRTERADRTNRVNEKRSEDDREHQRRPDPADKAVRPRPLRRGELRRAEPDRRQSGVGVRLNDRLGRGQGGEVHGLPK